MDWIDEILDEEPISNSQIAVIEGLLGLVPYSPEVIREIEDGLLDLSNQEAYHLIVKLRADHTPRDPAEQFKRMFN